MSSFQCPLTTVDVVQPHPNADRLDLVTIRGWRAVCAKGLHQPGDTVLYIPTDAVLPANVMEAFGYVGVLSGPNKDRVRTVKLRGEVSQGLVVPLERVLTLLRLDPMQITLGMDLAGPLGITKWEPPIPVHLAGEVQPAPEWFRHYYDLEHLKNWPGVFQANELVVVTEKLHGTNCRVALHADGHLYVASRNRDRMLVESPNNLYWRAASPLRDGLATLFDRFRAQHYVMVIGEVYGHGVQDLAYGVPAGQVAFRGFELVVDGQYQSYDDLPGITDVMPWVPLLWLGDYDPAVIDTLTAGTSTLAEHVREGVVVRPFAERVHPELGRVVLKSINPDYELRHGGTEFH